MITAIVIGNLWSTRKAEQYVGQKLLWVQPIDPVTRQPDGSEFLAIDGVGAGEGETVVVVKEGKSAMAVLGAQFSPVDAAIVAIIDHIDLLAEPA